MGRHNMDVGAKMEFQWILNKRVLVHPIQYSLQCRPTCEYEGLTTIKYNRAPNKDYVYRIEDWISENSQKYYKKLKKLNVLCAN